LPNAPVDLAVILELVFLVEVRHAGHPRLQARGGNMGQHSCANHSQSVIRTTGRAAGTFLSMREGILYCMYFREVNVKQITYFTRVFFIFLVRTKCFGNSAHGALIDII
jgi:hypothetical protein